MKKKILITMASMTLSLMVHAEAFSIGSGYNLGEDLVLSVDGGVSLGDFTAYGGRVNLPVHEQVLLFAGLAMVEPDMFDSELAYGGGVLVRIPDLDLPMELGVKASYYLWSTSDQMMGVGYDLDISELTFRLVASGEVEPVDGLSWYGEIGYHMLEADISAGGGLAEESVDENELGIEAGVIFALTDTLSVFGGVEIVDDNWINAGIRYTFE